MSAARERVDRELRLTLQYAMTYVEEVNRANGWYDHGRPFPADIALLHSEVSEMFEAYRMADERNLAEEAADVFIRLLDTCHRHGIDLGAEFTAKMQKNAERPYRHGGKRV